MASSTEGCCSYGKTFIGLMSCGYSSKIHTDDSLKKEFFVVIGAGTIFSALFVIGIVSKMGWITAGGGLGLLLTAYASYNHWNGVKSLSTQNDGFYGRRLIEFKNFLICSKNSPP